MASSDRAFPGLARQTSPGSDRGDGENYISQSRAQARQSRRLSQISSRLSGIFRRNSMFSESQDGLAEGRITRASVNAAVAQRFGTDSLPGKSSSTASVKKGLTAGFIQVAARQDSNSSLSVPHDAHLCRKYLSNVLRNPLTELILLLVLLFNTGLM
eukprot:TRINITY_DN84830_c0_g1_i1.p1 TRINITY_DN84830_c0_g1~~TRINITY_DN84830_c0_g1_i1.p1  ORF type:complete len:157 (-),score=3.24 TRINITY_DN84830_c0_g1_i1:14-484(-)